MSSKPLVFLTRPSPPNGVELLAKECEIRMWKEETPISREDFLKQSRGANALFIHPSVKIDDELLDSVGTQLKVVGTMSVGLDHVDIEACKKRGVKVGYTPDVLTSSVAELTVGLLIATARKLKPGFEAAITGQWKWQSGLWMTGIKLEGKVLGIVGLGRIGIAVAKRLKGFGFSKIVYCGRSESSRAPEVSAEYATFDDVLKQSDFVVATCSVHAGNKELFDQKAFTTMKKTAIFINVTRGALVNQDDLYDALASGEIYAAGIDVTTPEPLPPDHKLHQLPNITISPHLGSATREAREAMCGLTALNILAGLKDQPLPSPVPL
ncbi:hypothetical protein LOTGIDRAFT_177834 [Lottia gigantea]|uniref:Glyoxylate reductase/hydroxypyruvate reductase n=1 Tax=Lottia gigantea TaxID=225164 RepID=V4AYW4_LOTGI|nr:hypothetical protein LOTGIDRAFT_177834 [Lottia gigantea]ESP02883.1 hypothetical protein LOTGIDRAFT_177834 [Lottia gigantea]